MSSTLGSVHPSHSTAPGSVPPGNRFDAMLERFPSDHMPPLILAVGLDPALLDALDRRGSPTRVLAIEPSPLTAQTWIGSPLARTWIASRRLTVLVGPAYEGRNQAWQLVQRHALNPPMIVSPRLQQECPNETRDAKAVARQVVLGAQSNEEARKRFAGRYLVNTLTNLPTIATEGDAAALANLFKGLPAIVVGAGPSLDTNLTALKAVCDRAVLIAVDTAVRPLMAAGVHPHVVVSVDPADANARHLADLPDARGLWFVAEGSLAPQVFPQFEGRTFIFKVSGHDPWPWLAAQGVERGTQRAWGSVLTTTFDLALAAGCDPIVFVGADLAYTSGLQYCRNTVYEGEWSHLPTDAERAAVFADFIKSRPHLTVRDVSGRDTVTVPHFVQFRDWIVSEASAARPRRVVNATGAGILHGGAIERRSLQKVVLPEGRALDEDIRERLADAWRRSTADSVASGQRIERALAYGQAIPVAEWLDFGGEALTAEQVLSIARSSATRLGEMREKTGYLARLRQSYDSRIKTLDDARALSHGHYDIAARRAPSQQAHVLLDFLQRTYAPGAPGLLGTLAAIAASPRRLRALDVGCGVGRLMQPLVEAGFSVDGVDLSEQMIHFARQNPALAGCRFFLGSGRDCGTAPDGGYDLVYSQLLFRYVTSRQVRNDLLRAMARALKPGGMLAVELRFFPDLRADSIPAPHVRWDADQYHPAADAGQVDVRPTPGDLHLVYEDFARHFDDVRLQFIDVPREDRNRLPPQLLVSGTVGGSLADRVHARLEARTTDAAPR